ncbi:sulfite exporter TauE/SafE family protein [soil metagenome]
MVPTSEHRPTGAPPAWWRIILVGAIAGFTSGLFGVGGGIVMVPALTLLAGYHHKLATGTSLTAIVPISVAGAGGYATAGEIDGAVAALIATGAVVGAVLGTRYLQRINAPTLQLVFAGFMVVTAVRMVAGEDVGGDGIGPLTVATVVGLVVLGLAAGMLAGLLGVGGGIIIVPALTLLFGVPLVLAKGTSLAVIVPTAIMGTIRNRSSGLTALRPGVTVGVAGMLSALAASQLSLGLDPTVSAALFALLLVAVAVHLARTALVARRAPT